VKRFLRRADQVDHNKTRRIKGRRTFAAATAFAMLFSIWAGLPLASGGNSGYGVAMAQSGVPNGAAGNDDSMGIAAGAGSSFVIAKNGTVYAWGANSEGQLGNGSVFGKAVPTAIDPSCFDSEVISIAAGPSNVLALTKNRSLYYWGTDHASGAKQLTPKLIDRTHFDGDVVDIRAMSIGFYARTSKGLVYAWGYNDRGWMGLGDYKLNDYIDVPVLVDFGGDAIDGIFVSTSSSGNYAFAVSNTGAVYGWGDNTCGQMGTTATTAAIVRPQLIALSNGSDKVKYIAAARYAVFAVTESGEVYAWGEDTFQSPDPINPLQYPAPQAIPASNFGGKRVKSISCGSYGNRSGRYYAVTENGDVYAWGYNDYGALGIGDNDPVSGEQLGAVGWYYKTPVPMPRALFGGKQIMSVSNNYATRHSLAKSSDGSVYSWGDNYSQGALGTGETEDRSTSSPAIVTRNITFHANNGSWKGTSGIQNPVVSKLAFNSEVDVKMLPGNPERSGYICTGWNTKADGTGLAVDASMLVLEDMDAYAQWKIRQKDDKVVSPTNEGSARVSSFGVTQRTVYVKRGKTVRLPYIVYATASGKQSITWKASKKKVATVRKGKASGKLTVNGNANAKLTIKAGKKLGTGKILLAAANGKKLTIKVKVVKKLKKVAKKSVKIKKLGKKAAKRLKVGQTKRLRAKFTKKATAIATWKSSKPKVARIDAAGKLTLLKKGTAKITLKVGGKKKVIKITVR
jgi:alpha-tubulin suppressor-like RCC1 family protein